MPLGGMLKSNIHSFDRASFVTFVTFFIIVVLYRSRSMETIRDAPFGQALRWLTGNKVLRYPEEKENFEIPLPYRELMEGEATQSKLDNGTSGTDLREPVETHSSSGTSMSSTPENRPSLSRNRPTSETLKVWQTEAGLTEKDTLQAALTRTMTREMTRAYTKERYLAEREESLQRKESRLIIPQVTNIGDILVDWYETQDSSNPQNWSSGKKAFVGLQLL